jgi:hypothetical protein
MCHSWMDGHGLPYLFRQLGRPIAEGGTKHVEYQVGLMCPSPSFTGGSVALGVLSV